MANAWINLVKEKLRLGKSKNNEFSLKDAIQEAKKEWHKPDTETNVKKTQKQRRKKNSRRLRRTNGKYTRKHKK